MGQRHQLFVIAKINGRYRNLAAVHHQWLYGATALKRCHGLVQIFQAVENRVPLEQELLSALHLDEQSWKDEKRGVEGKAFVPFPMIATCLILGASFDSTDGYLHGVDIEPFGMEYNEGDNNNGITIIDVSELHHVRYCFADISPWGMESQTPVPLMTPLSASAYLWSYYDESKKEDQERYGNVIDRLEKWDLIDVAALRETWPKGTWRDPGEVEDSGDETDPGGQSESDEEEEVGTEERYVAEVGSRDVAEPGGDSLPIRHAKLSPDSSTFPNDPEEPLAEKMASLSTNDTAKTQIDQVDNRPATGSVTLRDSAMQTMLEAALQQSVADLRLWMPEAEILTDFLPSLRRKLYEDPTALKTSPAGLYLLCRALEHEYHVDLAPLKTLTTKDIEMVVSKLREQGSMKSIVLSNLPDLRVEDLEEAFVGESSLRSFYLLGTPRISINAIVSFVNSHMASLQDLYHTELLRRPLQLRLHRWRREDKARFSANSVNQMIWIRTDAVKLNEEGMRLGNGEVDWQKLLEAEKKSRSYEPSLTYGVLPLDDILLPPVKFVTGLAKFLRWMTRCDIYQEGVHSYGTGAANAFAMAKSSIQGSDYQVGPLPCALYATKTKSFPRRWPWITSELIPGKWAIVIHHEGFSAYDKPEKHPNISAKISYALVTTRDSSDQDPIVADMSSFLNQVSKDGNNGELNVQELQNFWIEQSKNILSGGGAVELYDGGEVRNLLRKVFSEVDHESDRGDPYDYYYDSH